MVALHRHAELLDPFAAAPPCGEIVLVHVGGVEDRLGGEQTERAQELDRVRVLARFARPAACVQLLHDPLEQHELGLGFLVPRAR